MNYELEFKTYRIEDLAPDDLQAYVQGSFNEGVETKEEQQTKFEAMCLYLLKEEARKNNQIN